jgi:hypothetical protein
MVAHLIMQQEHVTLVILRRNTRQPVPSDPRSNRYCAFWFKKQQQTLFLDSAFLDLKPASRDISHYSSWWERQILEEEFTE